MSTENEVGTLIIVILKARNLNDKHSFYKQDVFAQGSLNGVTKRTKVDVKGGQHPIWDEEIRFPVFRDKSTKNRKLEVACFAKEPRSDDILGRGTVDITETLRTGEFDEWVSLDVDGVVRGDLYLEMTYFSNSPAAPTTLAVPSSNVGLSRRPSKLSPSDRLYRPSQPMVPPSSGPLHSNSKPYQVQGVSAYPSDGRNLLPPSPSSSRSSSAASIKRIDSPLPPLPEESQPAYLPSTLMPGGGGARPRPQEKQPLVPPMLRPGSNNTSPIQLPRHEPVHSIRHPSSPTPFRDDYLATPISPTFGSNKVSQHTHQVSHQATAYPSTTMAPAPVSSYTPPPQSLPQFWATGHPQSGLLSFPVPTVTPVQERNDYRQVTATPEQPPIGHHHSGGDSSRLPDPYLQARYQTPLPLPPGPANPPRGRQSLSGRSTPSPSRIEALRLVEEEAARRKEQENKDLELALQLDRELNLAEQPPTEHASGTGSNTHMPGQW